MGGMASGTVPGAVPGGVPGAVPGGVPGAVPGAVTGGAPRLAIATHNAHKVGEIWAILASELPDLARDQVVSSSDLGAPAPVEDGLTFAENALIKARALAQASGLPAIADDSGLCVDVLGGAPGIFSALWSGTHGADQANLDLLLAQLVDIAPAHRGATFMCVAALATPDGREVVFTGEMRGQLLTQASGGGGFGYDPIFMALGQRVSNAELSPEEKNAISHRGQAFRGLARQLEEMGEVWGRDA